MKQDTIRKPDQNFDKKLLQGSVRSNIISLALPILFGNIIANAYYIIDMIFVGRLGPDALAAVGQGGILMSFTWTILLGLSIGTSALVARFYGAENKTMLSKITVQSLYLSLSVILLLALFGLFGVKYALLAMGSKENVLKLGLDYTKIVFIGSGTLIFLFILNSIFRGSGDVKTPMISLAVSSILNIILDFVLIFGLGPFPAMGVKGAAIATVIAQGVGAFLNFYILYSGRSHIKVQRWFFKPDISLLKDQIGIGFPGSLQNLFNSISGFILMHLVAGYGTFAIAAYGIGLRIDLMMMLPGWAFGAASATILGQNLGAGNRERARQTAWQGVKLYQIVLFVLAALLFSQSDYVIRLFNSEPSVVAIGSGYIKTVAVGYLFLSLSLVLIMAMNGAGYTVTPMIIVAVSILLVRIPGAYLLSNEFGFGLKGVWYAIAISIAIQALLSTLTFIRGNWQNKRINSIAN